MNAANEHIYGRLFPPRNKN